MLSAILLAAGTSQRMGGINKLLLPYKNRPVISNVAENILEGGIEELIVVLGHQAVEIKNALKEFPVVFVNNPSYEKGMTTSIQQGIDHAKGDGFMICLSDMVLISPAEYSFMKVSFENEVQLNPQCICIPRYKNEKGNPVIFSSTYRETILQHKEMEGCKEIVQTNKKNIFWIEMDSPHVLQDFDYPEDYTKIASSK